MNNLYQTVHKNGRSSTLTQLYASENSPNYVWVNPDLAIKIRQKLRRSIKRKNFLYHYLYFCSTIAQSSFLDKRYEDHEFVPINYKTMVSKISRTKYPDIKNDLINWEIIEVNESYQEGVSSKGFKLNPPYDQNLKRRKIKDELINQKLNDRSKRSIEKVLQMSLAYQYLAEKNTYIRINYEAAADFNLDCYFKPEEKKSRFESNFYSINAFKDKEYRFKVDDFGNRIHTNLTNLKSDLRGFLTVDRMPLGQVDIKNSQPLFFYLHIRDLDLIPFSEKELYKQLVEDGEFYEFFMQKLGIPLEQRGDVKHKILAALFFDLFREEESKYVKVFREEFPSIVEYIERIRKEDHKHLARILQRAESGFVIEKVVTRYIEKYGEYSEFISTIHDSIVVKTDMLKEAEQIMMECFVSERIKPQLSIAKF